MFDPFNPHLAHLGYRLVKDPTRIVGALPHQVDLPRAGGTAQVLGDLLQDHGGNLGEDRLGGLPFTGRRLVAAERNKK